MSLALIDYYLCNIQETLYRLIDEVLHHPRFQELEALWLALQRCHCQNYQLMVLHLTSTELSAYSTHRHLGKLLYDNRFNMPGGIPISVLAITEDPIEGSLSLCNYTRPAFTTVFSNRLFHQQPLARERYTFEHCQSDDDFNWENPVFNIIKPSSQTVREQILYSTDDLNMSIITTRFLHYIKILLRDAIGRFDTIDQFEIYLHNWILSYCSQSQNSLLYPLKSAAIEITEQPNRNSYHCCVELQPHDLPFPNQFILPFTFG